VITALSLLLLLPTEPTVVGVITAPRRTVTLSSGSEPGGPARTGANILAGAQLETGQEGWVEVRLLDDARFRLSAEGRVFFESRDGRPLLHLLSGRAWLVVPGGQGRGAARVVVAGHAVRIDPASSVILEATSAGALTLTTRRGLATIEGAPDVLVPRGATAREGGDLEGGGMIVKPGGDAIADLVELETRTNLGDQVGLRTFLLGWAKTAPIGRLDTRGVQEILRLGPEISGATSLPDATLEGAIRPAPFFATEVPPKGPNVKVNVTYGGN
jgi:hypothetical protein